MTHWREIMYKYILNYTRVAFMCTCIWLLSYVHHKAPVLERERELIYILVQMTSALIQREACCLLFFYVWKGGDFLIVAS
jgi:hypothetical protein